jgi:ERCC4-type nuclease
LSRLRVGEQQWIDECVYIIDSREQYPLTIKNETTETRKLDCGDYSIEGPGMSFVPGNNPSISIERKSLSDLVGTLTSGRDRFTAELERSRLVTRFDLIIETGITELMRGNYPGMTDSLTHLVSLMALTERYNMRVWFADNHAMAGLMVRYMLKYWVRELIVSGKIRIEKATFSLY